MKRVLLLVLFVVLATAVSARAQAPAGAQASDPVSKLVKAGFDGITRYLTASAEKMPEEQYGFKPTPEVRSFGEILAHVANTHYAYCSRLKGEKNPNQGNDFEKKTAKADIVKALADSIAYCAPVYSEMTDVKALEPPPAPPAATPAPPAKAPQGSMSLPQPRLRTLLGNVTHDWEHYGNLVTYMRLKGIVPPSSEPRR